MSLEKKIAVIDYGAGNLKNVCSALNEIGLTGIVTRNPREIDDSHGIILPGVGAFRDAIERINALNLREVLDRNVARGKLFQGICLGMQMLFDASEEDGYTEGLGYIPGTVVRIEPGAGRKVPHMGWNELILTREDPYLNGLKNGDYVYYVHSYRADPADFDTSVLAWSEYGERIPGIVHYENVIGTQFHPEKSAKAGQVLLNNLKEMLT